MAQIHPDVLAMSIAGIFVVVMWGAIAIRRCFWQAAQNSTSATIDSAAGLFILLAGVIAAWAIQEFAQGSISTVVADMTKLLASAIGAMYLKAGYEKHDKEWESKK